MQFVPPAPDPGDAINVYILYSTSCSSSTNRINCNKATADQWSADVGCRHAADASAHGRRADADVADLGGKQFAGVNVDDGEGDGDEQLPEHRERHRRRVVICIVRASHERQQPVDRTRGLDMWPPQVPQIALPNMSDQVPKT